MTVPLDVNVHVVPESEPLYVVDPPVSDTVVEGTALALVGIGGVPQPRERVAEPGLGEAVRPLVGACTARRLLVHRHVGEDRGGERGQHHRHAERHGQGEPALVAERTPNDGSQVCRARQAP